MMYCRDLLRSWVYLCIGCRLRVNIGGGFLWRIRSYQKILRV